MLGVAFDGMQQLVERGQSRIGKALMLGWFGEIQQIERQNEVVNSVLRELVELYRGAGVSFVVMKGQTAGAMYPNPLRRQSGDIDVFVWNPPCSQTGHDSYREACRLIEANGATLIDLSPEKHAEYTWHNVVVEVHHTLLDMFCPSALHYLEQLDYSQMVEEREVAGIQVACFKPAFNCAYMLGHMVHHLLTEGLGLRQVCDWMLLMKEIEGQVSGNGSQDHCIESIQEHLSGMKLFEAFSVFVAMGTKHFCLDGSLWQWAILPKSPQEAERLMTYIMECGNFGRKANNKHDCKSLTGNLFNAWTYFGHLLRLRHIAPSEVLYFFPVRISRWWKKKL